MKTNEQLDKETAAHIVTNRGKVDTTTSAQVGGNHYGTGVDAYKFSLEREHDCLQHSAIKYIDRHKLKNGEEDIRKAISVLVRILKEQY